MERRRGKTSCFLKFFDTDVIGGQISSTIRKRNISLARRSRGCDVLLQGIASFCLGAFLLSCATLSLERPEINLLGVEVKDITLSHVNMLADLRLFNPNPAPITVSSIKYELHLNSIKVMNGSSVPGVVIAPNEYGYVSLRVSSPYWNLLKLMQNLQTAEDVAFSLAGEVRLGGWGPAGFSFPFKEEGNVPLTGKDGRKPPVEIFLESDPQEASGGSGEL